MAESVEQITPRDIFDVLEEARKKTNEDPTNPLPIDIDLGTYTLNRAVPSLIYGDGLEEPSEKRITIVKATEENKLVGADDAYQGTKFKSGDKVVLIGESETPLGLDSLDEYLSEDTINSWLKETYGLEPK